MPRWVLSDLLRSRRGAALVFVALSMTALLGTMALSVDLGMLYYVRTHLQGTADASALAAVQELPDVSSAVTVAQEYATANAGAWGTVVSPNDVAVGYWDPDTGGFTASGTPTNAVGVRARRSQENGNAVGLFFARFLGMSTTGVQAWSVAVAGNSGVDTRFLIDEEMIDTDIPVLEDLAASLGVDKDSLIGDPDGDWFINIPPGTTLELPTGQVGDEGLFDITHEAFPFDKSSDPSFTDFLNYNEDSNSWRYDLIPKDMLDPLMGVSVVNDPDAYDEFVDPEHCTASPVFKSDVSELNPVMGDPAVNALGERRGLLAFKVMAVGSDPDGPGGSVLPNLVIETCDPNEVLGEAGIASISPWPGTSRPRLVH